MSRTGILRNSRDDKAVKFLEFIRLHSKNPEQLCCFFEGDDAKYYCVRITTLLPNKAWTPINCRGKKQVLEIYTLLSQHPDYSKAATAFFVDRDFDAPLSDTVRQRVYETPCYSVENFYTSLNCFRQIIQSEFGFTDGTDASSALETCCSLFISTQKSFHEAIAELNAWIFIQRRQKDSVGHVMRLNDVRFDRFVAVGLGVVTKLYSFAELREIFPEAAPVTAGEVAHQLEQFREADCARIFRGKYEIEFVRLILAKLMEDFCSKTPRYFPRSGTVRCTLSKSNLISELSQYSDTPECLRHYLLRLN